MSKDWKQIEQFITQADELLITSHIRPDGDALGATLAMAIICQQMGKSVTCVNDGPIPSRLAFLPGIEQIQEPSQIHRKFRHVIAVDVSDHTRMGEAVSSLFSHPVSMLNIDHHVSNDAFGTINVIDPQACSTAEVLYRWIHASEQIEWNPALATCLYTGILTDTGGFRYSNTTAEVLRQAAHLIELGAPNSEIADQTLEKTSWTQMKLYQKALSTLHISETGQLSWVSLTQDDLMEIGAEKNDIDGIVNLARNLEGVEVGLLFYAHSPTEIKVSFRSSQWIDVASIAEEWNGGGHARAAGCTIQGSLLEVKGKVIKRLEAELERGPK